MQSVCGYITKYLRISETATRDHLYTCSLLYLHFTNKTVPQNLNLHVGGGVAIFQSYLQKNIVGIVNFNRFLPLVVSCNRNAIHPFERLLQAIKERYHM